MNIDQLFPRKWLAAGDLAGHAVTVTIEAVTLEQVRNPRTNREEPKLAVAFVGKKKRLLVNKTQAYALAAIAGKETEDWIGRQVTLSAAVAPNGAQTIAVTPAAASVPATATATALAGLSEAHEVQDGESTQRHVVSSHDEIGDEEEGGD